MNLVSNIYLIESHFLRSNRFNLSEVDSLIDGGLSNEFEFINYVD